ncbi:hypothetical protein D9M69_632560 [compost metagenome]
MALLVFVVVRRGEVEIAHDVACRLGGLFIMAFFVEVQAQPVKQAQHAIHPLVAGGQHLEGLLESGRGRLCARLADLVQADAGHGVQPRRTARPCGSNGM